MSLFRALYTETLEVANPLFRVHTESIESGGADDTHDMGFVGQYWNGTTTVYTGLFRDASDSGKYKLFDGLEVLPTVDTGLVNTGGTGYTLASLDVLNLIATGDVTVSGNLTVNGTTTTVNVETLTVEDNIIIANGGPANMKEDGGFVVKRIATNVDDDTPKQSGTASAGGSTTTIVLQASNGHGTTLDYYKGWIIKLGGDLNSTHEVTTSSAADPPTLTFTPAASAATTTSTTYQLHNKHFVGTIFDESTDLITFYGFPREDTEAIIDPAGNAGNGNLADFMSIKAQAITANTSVTATTSMSAGTTITAGTGITATTGDVTASSGNVTASGAVSGNTVSATTTVTAGTGLTVTTGDATISSGNLNITNGNATISGDLTVSGTYKGPLKIDDNILAINTGPTNALEDGGFVVQRSATNVAAADVPKLATVAVQTNYTAPSTTLLITNAATGTDYFKGWIITNSVDGTGVARTINSSTESGGTHTLVLSTGFVSNLTAGTDTVNLYNKRFVGMIYDESKDEMRMLGFPREDAEATIDVESPVNGNIPDYVNLTVGNLDVTGNFTFAGTVTKHTKTQASGDYTFTSADMYDYDIIYLDPSNAVTTFTLPTIASLSIPTNTAVIIVLVNIDPANRAVIARGGSDTIEGATSLQLRNQWQKTVLFASAASGSTWLIKG